MKKKFLKQIVLFAAMLFTLAACSNEEYHYDNPIDEMGQLDLKSLAVSVDVQELATKAKAAIDVKDYQVRIVSAQNEEVVGEWIYGEMPQVISLKVGKYRLEAASHTPAYADFEAPYYAATQNFEIIANQVTPLESIICRLSNIRVTITYDVDLALLMGDDVKVEVEVGNSALEFDQSEVRSGYFMPTQELNILTAKLTGTIEGDKAECFVIFKDVKAGEHRKIHFSLKDADTGENNLEGDASLNIAIDATCDIYEDNLLVDVEEGLLEEEEEGDGQEPGVGNDDLTIKGRGFDIQVPQIIPEGGMAIVVDIDSKKGVQNLFVNIDSPILTEDELASVGLVKSFDLAHPGDLEEKLIGLGFPVGEDVINANHIAFDITAFTGLLYMFDSATHNFQIRVVDLEGNETTETLKLTVQK